MKKVLFVASVTRHINAFHIPFLEQFKNNGYTVEVASNGEAEIPFCDTRHQVKFERNPLKIANITAYFKLNRIINEGNYTTIHCHTPVAAMLARLASRKARKKGTKVIYTAHGFHFFKGAPLLNWLIYFPIEWVCSFFTDTLITINKEDYAFAKKHMHANQIEYVPGVGLNIDAINSVSADREQKREELGIPKGSVAVLSVGELNENKNHETVLRAIASLDRRDIVYVICGEGNKRDFLQQLAKDLNMGERLILLGHRSDVYEINKCCDIFAFPSLREGLPISLLEALACGLPAVVSRIRGNVDLIEDGKNGFFCGRTDVEDFAEKIRQLANNKELCSSMSVENKEDVKKFDLKNILVKMKNIYFTKTPERENYYA